jgi:lipid-binding SYLF domain-containing protein
MKKLNQILCLFVAVVLTACSAPGNTRSEQKQHIETMQRDVLSRLYQLKPDTKEDIRNAAGYAVFSNANVYLLFVSAGNGFGVAVNNRNGKKTYMKMGELGLGYGAGAKDYRVVFVFNNAEKFNQFIENGWSFGGQADAAIKADEKGGALGGKVLLNDVTVYQITETGLALQATIMGTHYWQDSNLN